MIPDFYNYITTTYGSMTEASPHPAQVTIDLANSRIAQNNNTAVYHNNSRLLANYIDLPGSLWRGNGYYKVWARGF